MSDRMVSLYNCRTFWERFICGIFIYHLLTIPFRIAFNVPDLPILFYTDIFADLVYTIDVCGGFYLSFYVKEEKAYFTRDSRLRYWKRWVFVDLIGAIPYDLVVHLLAQPLSPIAAAWWRLPRLLRGLHLTHWMIGRKATVHSQYPVLGVVKRMAAVLLCTHVLGCLWFFQTTFSDENTWLQAHDLVDAPIVEQYIYAHYWALATITTVGYGDITPKNATEVLFTMGAMFIGVVLWAYLIAVITSYLANRDYSSVMQRERLNQVQNYLHYRDIPDALCSRVLDYYDHLWMRNKAFNENEIFDELPQGLRIQIALHLNKEILRRVPFFQGLDQGAINSLVTKLRPQIACPGETVVRQGEMGQEMYFLSSGEVEVLTEKGGCVNTLTGGAFFGELSLLKAGRRTATVKAITFCDLFVLSKEDFDEVLKFYPELASQMKAVSGTQLHRSCSISSNNR